MGGYRQTTVVRFECAGVRVSVGIAPSLSATRWERTLSGEIRETSRSIFGRSCAQSRMAAAASVAYPCPSAAASRPSQARAEQDASVLVDQRGPHDLTHPHDP